MMQELFRIPLINLPVYGYGLMLVIGFLSAVQLAKLLSRRVGIDPDLFVNAGLIALISGVAGSRLSHVLENLDAYTRADLTWYQNLLNMINIRSGGLTFYGGLILGTIATGAYLIWKKVPLRKAMDVGAPAVMLGLAFGRIGCFLNGCCFGGVCTGPGLAVQFPYYSPPYQEQYLEGRIEPPRELLVRDASGRQRLLPPTELQQHYPSLTGLATEQRSLPIHATQLYSSFNAFLLTAVLTLYFTLPHAAGRVFALMLILKGISRYLLELLRIEPAVLGRGTGVLEFLPPHSFSMTLSIFLLIGGVVMWFVFRDRRDESTGLQPVSAAATA